MKIEWDEALSPVSGNVTSEYARIGGKGGVLLTLHHEYPYRGGTVRFGVSRALRRATRRACEAEGRRLLEDMYWACRQACLDWGIDVDEEEEPERGA